MTRRTITRSIAVSAALLLAVAGCQTAPVANQATGPSEINLGKANTGAPNVLAPITPGDTPVQTPVVVDSVNGRMVGPDGAPLANVRVNWGSQVTTTDANGNFSFPAASDAGYITAFPAGHAPVMAAVTGSQMTLTAAAGDAPMSVSAAAGAQYVSPDGALKAQIPPGALTADTQIRISRIDTANIPVTDWYIPGIQFAVDLGGAQLAPDTQITVSAKLDARFIEEMKERDPDFSTEKYMLSQDANGEWTMMMQVKGPASSSAPIAEGPVTVPFFGLNEFGGLPLPPVAEGTPTASYKVNFVPGTYDYDDEQVRLTNGVIIRAPKTTAEWSSMEAAGVFGCGVFPHCYYYGKLRTRQADKPARDALVREAKALDAQIAAYPAPTPNASGEVPVDPALESLKSQRAAKHDAIRALDAKADAASANCDIEVERVNIPTHTTWISDDPTVNGKDAQGVNIRFSMLVGAFSGPNDILTDASGNATSNGLTGTDITVTPSFTLGGVSVSGTAQARVVDNMPPIQLKLVKNSPKVTVNFTSDAPIPNTLDVTYSVDGGAGVKKAALPLTYTNGNKAGKVTFFAPVPSDNVHTIKLIAVDAGSLAHGELPEGNSRRNGALSLDVKLFAPSAK